MINRRDFLRVGGAAAVAATWGGTIACARRETETDDAMIAGNGAFPIANIGVQLYTVRTLANRDLASTLAQVSGAGYRLVETAGLYDRPAAELRRMLDQYGLRSPAGHYPLELVESDADAAAATARTLGQEYVIVPWLAEDRRRTLDDYRAFGALLNRLGQRMKTAGLQFAYHNHDFEFDTFGGTKPGFDVLLENTDPELVAIELDLYWIYKAGHDALAYIDRYPGRFQLFHVKDGTAAPEKRMVDVGQGAIPFDRIFGASERAGTHYAFVEHDQPGDPIASITASRRHLERLLGS